MEGSLETSELVLDKLGINVDNLVDNLFKNKKHINKKTKINTSSKIKLSKVIKITRVTKKKYSGGAKNIKEYTLEEIAKHNTKSDAWIAIEGKVANITNWIPKHPGGDIIMKGVGKDATNLFRSIGHDEYARKMLKKYQIGIVKK